MYLRSEEDIVYDIPDDDQLIIIREIAETFKEDNDECNSEEMDV